MKKAKRLIALLLVIINVMVMAVLPANAAFTNTGKTFTLKEGGFLGIGATTYTYKVFKETGWYRIFHNLDVCPAIYHTKNKGTTGLTYTTSRTYTSQTSYNFSVTGGLGASAEVVSATVSATAGMTKSNSYSVSASGSVGRTIPTNASTGYYKMSICYNWIKYRLDKYQGSTYKTCTYAGIPTGNAYVSVLYGTSTSNTAYSKY